MKNARRTFQNSDNLSLCVGEGSYEVAFAEDDDEEVMVTMFMEEEDALADLEEELRDIE